MNGKSVLRQQFWKLSLLAAAILCGPALVNASENEQISALFDDDIYITDSSAPLFVPPAPTGGLQQTAAFQNEPTPAPPVEGSNVETSVPGTPIKSVKPTAPAAPIVEPEMTEYQQEMADFDMAGYQCGTASCDGCCDCSGDCSEPSWTASVGAIYLRRERGDDTTLIRDFSTASPTDEFFNSREFDFEHEVGYVVDVSQHNGMHSFQLRHFGVDGWNDSAIFGPSLGSFVGAYPRGSVGTGMGSLGATAIIKYSSQMLSTEANWMGESCSRFTPIVGARWIRFDERLDVLGSGLNPTITPYYDIDTHNDLYGGQLGGNLELIDGERFQVSVLGKVGAYANQARQRAKNRIPALSGGSVPGESQEANRMTTSIVYEAGLNGALKLTDNISVAGGYTLMWLSQLALAPSQLERNDLYPGTFGGPGTSNIDTGDYVIVHGGELNLTIEW